MCTHSFVPHHWRVLSCWYFRMVSLGKILMNGWTLILMNLLNIRFHRKMNFDKLLASNQKFLQVSVPCGILLLLVIIWPCSRQLSDFVSAAGTLGTLMVQNHLCIAPMAPLQQVLTTERTQWAIYEGMKTQGWSKAIQIIADHNASLDFTAFLRY